MWESCDDKGIDYLLCEMVSFRVCFCGDAKGR